MYFAVLVNFEIKSGKIKWWVCVWKGNVNINNENDKEAWNFNKCW